MDRHLIYICEICGTVLDEHHCKAQCPNCGRMFDCSDLPIMRANAMVDAEEGELLLPPGGDPLEVAGAKENNADAPTLPANESIPPTTLTVRPSMERKGSAQKAEGKGNVADLP
jgi:hypothetical protein